ncbi:MAG TPA: hypothetical protein DGH68_13065 [Bacteroidetes bacterium]|nr:hypothetical protein [Bacteroidota bacterium]
MFREATCACTQTQRPAKDLGVRNLDRSRMPMLPSMGESVIIEQAGTITWSKGVHTGISFQVFVYLHPFRPVGTAIGIREAGVWLFRASCSLSESSTNNKLFFT